MSPGRACAAPVDRKVRRRRPAKTDFMDIVKRLRNHALPDPHDEREVMHAPLLREAADEIERLRALCTRMHDTFVDVDFTHWPEMQLDQEECMNEYKRLMPNVK